MVIRKQLIEPLHWGKVVSQEQHRTLFLSRESIEGRLPHVPALDQPKSMGLLTGLNCSYLVPGIARENSYRLFIEFPIRMRNDDRASFIANARAWTCGKQSRVQDLIL